MNDCGIEIDLMNASPRVIEWHIRQTWTRLISQRVERSLQAKGFETQGPVDFLPARQVIESNVNDQVTPLQKGALRAVVCDAVWIKERLIKAGYQVDPLCELCGKSVDTVFHRI